MKKRVLVEKMKNCSHPKEDIWPDGSCPHCGWNMWLSYITQEEYDNTLTLEEFKMMEEAERKVWDACNNFDIVWKLKDHHNKGILVGDQHYIIKDKAKCRAIPGFDQVSLVPLEWY